jgi:hypothetical protein
MVNNLKPRYQVKIYDGSGNLIADVTGKHQGIRVTATKNRPEDISVSFDLNQIEDHARNTLQSVTGMFAVDINEIRILREDSTGINTIVAGQINATTASLDGDNKSIEVHASGWFELFDKRYTAATKTFSAVDAGTIAWTLINDSQSLTNGNFGITQGTIVASKTRDREYEYKNIKEAIIQLSEVINGFDFEFTYDKKFNVFYPRQGKDNAYAIPLRYPGNIKSINLPIDGTAIVNSVTLRGQGQGTEQLVVTRTNSPSQASYKLRQRIVDLNDVKETTTLNEHGDEILRIDASPFAIPQIVLRENASPVIRKDMWLDDPITIIVPESDIFDIIKGVIFRIESISISVDENDVETVSLNISQA